MGWAANIQDNILGLVLAQIGLNGCVTANIYPFEYSKISAGWQSSTLQIVSNVLKRMAFALPVFNMERLESVIPTFSESSFSDIFLLAIITSKFTIMGIFIQLIRFQIGFQFHF
jgi:hypothetical protein